MQYSWIDGDKIMDTKLLQAFNKQINHEFYSAYLYFAMSTYFSEISMQGFCDFMRHKTSQKLDCAQKIYEYLMHKFLYLQKI